LQPATAGYFLSLADEKRYKTAQTGQKTAKNCDQKHSIEIRPVLRVH
jgi:hypothetical protein